MNFACLPWDLRIYPLQDLKHLPSTKITLGREKREALHLMYLSNQLLLFVCKRILFLVSKKKPSKQNSSRVVNGLCPGAK